MSLTILAFLNNICIGYTTQAITVCSLAVETQTNILLKVSGVYDLSSVYEEIRAESLQRLLR
jgi:hypothetical protein